MRRFSAVRWKHIIGGVRVVGLRASLQMAIYRMAMRAGIYRQRTPIRSWQKIEDSLPRTASFFPERESPRFFFASALPLGSAVRRLSAEIPRRLRAEWGGIRKGCMPVWGREIHAAGIPPEWNRNILTGEYFQVGRHWSEVDEESGGDIKGFWELSRFGAAFKLARIYAVLKDDRAAETFWRLVESWMEQNPPQSGPQWMSAQEVALRVLAWEFGVRVVAASPSTTPERTRRMLAAIAESARRIEATTLYARAQRNNHLLSEAAGLITIGILHPDLPGASRWRKLGFRLMQDGMEQFFPDGGYIQHSWNYQRLALQVLLWSLRLAELNRIPVSGEWSSRLQASLELLSAQVDLASGRLANFGHNDGSLLFGLNVCGYDDYRPILQSLSLFLHKRPQLPQGVWDEDALWILGHKPATRVGRAVEEVHNSGPTSAAKAGLYLLRNVDSHAVFRCVEFHHRPAHSDQLHVDLWWRGVNIALDAGTYLYSGEPAWRNSLAWAAVHNTVTVEGCDPMERSGRFLWTTLARGIVDSITGAECCARHDGYRHMGIVHRRILRAVAPGIWIVDDVISGQGSRQVRLHWLLPDGAWRWITGIEGRSKKNLAAGLKLDGAEGISVQTPAGSARLFLVGDNPATWSLYRAGSLLAGKPDAPSERVSIRGWHSPTYAVKEPALSVAVSIHGELPLHFSSVWVLGR